MCALEEEEEADCQFRALRFVCTVLNLNLVGHGCHVQGNAAYIPLAPISIVSTTATTI